MVKSDWRLFGTSVRGPGHVRTGLPNQDALRIVKRKWGDVVVVSDGVGSCPTSDRGSFAACLAVIRSACQWTKTLSGPDELLKSIHQNWIKRLGVFSPRESAATCLFAFRPIAGRMILGMLGDGLIAVLKSDGSYAELSDDKVECFSNQTAALSENVPVGRWRTMAIEQDECDAVFLCTDGIADDLLPERREEFVRWIFDNAQPLSKSALKCEMRKMLEQWPTPKHSDDKTLAALFRRKGVS